MTLPLLPAQPRLCIVGGGIAGLILATRLGERLGRYGKAQVTLVDDSATHVWKPMLHTFAAGTWNIYQQQLQYLVHAREHQFDFVQGRLCDLDPAARRLTLAPLTIEGEAITGARTLDYDILFLAYGSRANDFTLPGVQAHCHFIDSLAQADAFNRRMRAYIARSAINQQPLSVAIVGGGATGVELAAELSRLAELAQGYGATHMPTLLRLTLLESTGRILQAFPENIAASATAQLRALGVDVRTDVRVAGADAQGFVLADGSRIDADLLVWAAGIRAGDALPASVHLARNPAGQLLINPTLQTDDPHIFALGDCASLVTPEHPTKGLPATAQVANQQALHLAQHFPAWLRGTPLPDFQYHEFGALVSLGDYNAFGTLGRYGFYRGGFIEGRVAQLSHLLLYRRHQLTLHGPGRSLLLWFAECANRQVQPRIKIG